jgi:hypothetical protein
LFYLQANAYPWMAALMRDSDDARDSHCSAVLVSYHHNYLVHRARLILFCKSFINVYSLTVAI